MPSLARITNTFFTSLIDRLGIRPPFLEGFEISNTVVPVSLVDADILLDAQVSTPSFDTTDFNSAGELTAAAANTRHADTGAKDADTYDMILWIKNETTSERTYRLRRRNAADSADIWSMRWGLVAGSSLQVPLMRVLLAQGERLVVENVAAIAAGGVSQAVLWVKRSA